MKVPQIIPSGVLRSRLFNRAWEARKRGHTECIATRAEIEAVSECIPADQAIRALYEPNYQPFFLGVSLRIVSRHGG